MRRFVVLALLLGLCAPWRAAVAQDAPVAKSPVDDVAAARARVEESRASMELRYGEIERQHEQLRRLAQEVEVAERAGGLPGWLTADAVRRATKALADDARAGIEPGADAVYAPLALVFPGRAQKWPLWGSVLMARARAFAIVDKTLSGAEIVAKSILVIAATPTPEAWDGWFQDDPIVIEWRARNARLEALQVREAAAAPSQLIALAGGRFAVGPWEGWTSDLGPKRNKRTKVSIKLLHVDRDEVTCGQYQAYLLTVDPKDRAALLPSGWELSSDGAPVLPSGSAGLPVTGVTFAQARDYAASLGKRLPTENEWERIAAGGDEARVFPWGSEVGKRQWVHRSAGDAGAAQMRPVGEQPDDSSPEGVLGLAGNVKEMVATYADRKPVRGRVKPDARIVVRGGGFRTRASECQTRWRWFVEAGSSSDDVGFRCVMDDADFRRRGGR